MEHGVRCSSVPAKDKGRAGRSNSRVSPSSNTDMTSDAASSTSESSLGTSGPYSMMLPCPSSSSSSSSLSVTEEGAEPAGASVARAEGRRRRSRIANTDCLPLFREPPMTFSLRRNERKRESVIGTRPGGIESSGVAGPAASDCGAPDEVVASVAEGVVVGACGADQGLSSVWIRRARVTGSGGVTSSQSPSSAPGPGNEEPRRWRVGNGLVPGAAGAVPVAWEKSTPVWAAVTARRDVLGGMSRAILRGSEPVVGPVRGGSCGGLRGGGDGEEISCCGTPPAMAIGGGEVVDTDLGSNQEGGGNSAAFWLLFPASFCLPFLPNFTNCSSACILA